MKDVLKVAVTAVGTILVSLLAVLIHELGRYADEVYPWGKGEENGDH